MADVTISEEEYEGLLADRDFLSALEQAGVDNWVGYSYAFQILEGSEEFD